MIYFASYREDGFPEVFRAAIDVCTSFSLFYFGTKADDPIVEDLSRHRELFLKRQTNYIREWPGMKGMHEINFPATPENLDAFTEIVLKDAGTEASCDFWQFALFLNKDVILWFADSSEYCFDNAHIPVRIEAQDGSHPFEETQIESLNEMLVDHPDASALDDKDMEALVSALKEAFTKK